jgi:prepilin-type N-terminal cleavage/methylation domain-containing protein
MSVKFYRKPTNHGFTLIEMIVSLGIFSMIVTMTVGALLVLISGNQQLQGEQNAMTNLAFAIDSMTREIRTGSNYYCVGQPNYNAGGARAIFKDNDTAHESLGASIQDCIGGRGANDRLQGVSFFEGGNSITGAANERILYFYDFAAQTLKRKVGNNAPQPIVSSGVIITEAEFFVTGSDRLGGGINDSDQPTVTIYIEARQVNEPDKTYYIQTTVAQRILDL